ncbi:helix-turn-helix domain-containing protein [Anaerostipes caccae]|nr:MULTISPECIES: helix-turn-helix domain-containing protein [Anaerostipes]
MDQKKIGIFIALLRRERGITQAELGEKIGVTNKDE